MKNRIKTLILCISLILNMVFAMVYFSPVPAYGSSPGRTLVIKSSDIYANSQKSAYAKKNRHYLARESRFMNIYAYPGGTVFLGDSLTQFFDWAEVFEGSKNRGITSDTTGGVLTRLDSVEKLKPERVFIMIGINDLSMSVPEATIIKNYGEIIDRLQKGMPACELHVQSILPVAKPCGIDPKKIASVNASLKKLCDKKGVTYIDLTSVMSDANGSLRSGYHEDGVHLTTAGYAAWIKAIDKYV